MTVSAADRWCCRIVELAARVLPAEQRQRYALEFIAEAAPACRGHSSSDTRLRYSPMPGRFGPRSARPVQRDAQKETTMITTNRRPMKCRLGCIARTTGNPRNDERYEICLPDDGTVTGPAQRRVLWLAGSIGSAGT